MAPSGEVFGQAQNWIYFNGDRDDNARDLIYDHVFCRDPMDHGYNECPKDHSGCTPRNMVPVADGGNTQVRVSCCLLCIYMPAIDRPLSDCRSTPASARVGCSTITRSVTRSLHGRSFGLRFGRESPGFCTGRSGTGPCKPTGKSINVSPHALCSSMVLLTVRRPPNFEHDQHLR